MHFPNEIFYHILSFLPDSEIGKFDLPDSFWRNRAKEKLSIPCSVFKRRDQFHLTCKQRYFQLFYQRNFLHNAFEHEMSLEEEILIAAKYGTVEQISFLFSKGDSMTQISVEARNLCHRILFRRNPPRTDEYIQGLPKWLKEEIQPIYEELIYYSAILRQQNSESCLDSSSDYHPYWQVIFSEDPKVCEEVYQQLLKHLKEGCLDVSLAYIFSYLLSSPNEIYLPLLNNFFSDCRTIEQRISQSNSFFELLLCNQGSGKFIPSKKTVREWISYLADSSLCSHNKDRISFFLNQGVRITLNGILLFVQSPSPKNSPTKFEILETFSFQIEKVLKNSSLNFGLLFKVCFECLRNFDFDSLDFFLFRIPSDKRKLVVERLIDQNQNRLMKNYLNFQL